LPASTVDQLIDQVNELDEPIGVISRRDALRPGMGFRVVHIFAQNRDNQILLEHLSAKAERSPLRWGSSVAGYLHAGETYSTAARRRLYEELGLSTPLQKLGATRMNDQGATKFIELFTTRVTHGSDVRMLDEQADSLEWFSLDDITRLLDQTPQKFTETFPYVYKLFRTIAST
jgi:isopentenyl-diphosphate delta-isomerase